ncbi:MAG: M20/M25/M40 family metallo-hydrolase [Deltaproteobacteria bacterium]|nr:M20/M25/M40 family metallo-hydrolase [Deltaproteobacteria bacterium]
MKITPLAGIPLLLLTSLALVSFVNDPITDLTQKLSAEITGHGQAYGNLVELTGIGPRLSGSSGAARAVDWAKAKMESYGFDRVYLQSVMVPQWSRGQVEQATVFQRGGEVQLKVAALGNSVGTAAGGLEAQVIEVHSLQEVAERADEVRGKIVFYNRPMDPNAADTFEAYGGAVDQRTAGPAQAARYGAVAALVRSLTTLVDDDHPHTGMLSNSGGRATIPGAALSAHGANQLSLMLRSDPTLKLKLELGARRLPQVQSYNVVGELTGRELPGEIVVVGGHLDSWDLGVGAQDDGAGVVQSIEILRAMKALGIRPKRTVRAVLFMAEEFGGYGGREYANQARLNGEKHIAATESDRGGFAPVGFAVRADAKVLETVRAWAPYLAPMHADSIWEGESGADVGYLNDLGAATFGFVPESRHYFEFHHSALDTMEAVNAADLGNGAAAMATLTYLTAEYGL